MTDHIEAVTIADLATATDRDPCTAMRPVHEGKLPDRILASRLLLPRGYCKRLINGDWTPALKPTTDQLVHIRRSP